MLSQIKIYHLIVRYFQLIFFRTHIYERVEYEFVIRAVTTSKKCELNRLNCLEKKKKKQPAVVRAFKM